MAVLARSRAALRVMGDDLEPAEITALLGAPPTASQRRGEELVGRRTTRIARFGMWRLVADETEPADPDRQVAQILDQLTSDLPTWQALASRFEIDLFCGWFLERSNEGISLSPATLRALGERGIELGLDIYSGDDGEQEPA